MSRIGRHRWPHRRSSRDRTRDPARPAIRAGPAAASVPAGGAQSGAAVVDFVLVGGLLTMFFLALIQLSLALHVRNTLVDAAASGARYGTLADRSGEDARNRTTALIGTALGAGFPADVSIGVADYQGLRTLEVTVRAPLPVIGLIGPTSMLEVKGHAVIPP